MSSCVHAHICMGVLRHQNGASYLLEMKYRLLYLVIWMPRGYFFPCSSPIPGSHHPNFCPHKLDFSTVPSVCSQTVLWPCTSPGMMPPRLIHAGLACVWTCFFWTVRCLIPRGYLCSATLHLRLRENHGRGDCKRHRPRTPIARYWPPKQDRENRPMESQQYNCLMAPPVDMPTWTGEIPHDPTPGWRATGAQYLLSWIGA